jgi:hypothetical protein
MDAHTERALKSGKTACWQRIRAEAARIQRDISSVLVAVEKEDLSAAEYCARGLLPSAREMHDQLLAMRVVAETLDLIRADPEEIS